MIKYIGKISRDWHVNYLCTQKVLGIYKNDDTVFVQISKTFLQRKSF